jgi:hypothetical protein
LREVQVIKNITVTGFLITSALMLLSCGKMREVQPEFFEKLPEERNASHILRDDDGRMIAYKVTLRLTVENADYVKKIIHEQIKNNKGFIVSESSTGVYNNVNARIPSKNMDSFLDSARILGKKESEEISGNDITDEYRDNTAALTSLKKVRDRYLALLDKAKTVEEILKVEAELERVSLQIEKLEGEIKYAEQSVTYSLITVKFNEKEKLLQVQSGPKPGPVGWIFYGLYKGIKWLFVWD